MVKFALRARSRSVSRGAYWWTGLLATAAVGMIGVVGFPGLAHAGPTGVGDASAVINDLKAKGYRVIVSKSGAAADLSRCVASVEEQSPVYSAQPARDVRNAPTTVSVIDHKVALVSVTC
ncbi:hypothetical protein [Mycobacteroides saopaulense]|nr:hypothetical protein [Mycobacteroides saopaulense]